MNHNKTIITMGILLLSGMLLTACGSAAETPEASLEPTATEVVIEATTEPTEATEVIEVATEEPTAVLTTLVAPNPTAVESGITPQEQVIAANVAEADVAEGARLFNEALVPSCTECHIPAEGVRQRGPSLYDFAEVAGTRVEGEGAYTYAYNSIRYADQHILDGYEADVMRVYDGILTDQEVYELIAYIWTLTEE